VGSLDLPTVLIQGGGQRQGKRTTTQMGYLIGEPQGLLALLHGLIRITQHPQRRGHKAETPYPWVIPIEQY
jgi:hypothetical protein